MDFRIRVEKNEPIVIKDMKSIQEVLDFIETHLDEDYVRNRLVEEITITPLYKDNPVVISEDEEDTQE